MIEDCKANQKSERTMGRLVTSRIEAVYTGCLQIHLTKSSQCDSPHKVKSVYLRF